MAFPPLMFDGQAGKPCAVDQAPGYNPDDFLLLQRTMEAAGNHGFFTRLPPRVFGKLRSPRR